MDENNNNNNDKVIEPEEMNHHGVKHHVTFDPTMSSVHHGISFNVKDAFHGIERRKSSEASDLQSNGEHAHHQFHHLGDVVSSHEEIRRRISTVIVPTNVRDKIFSPDHPHVPSFFQFIYGAVFSCEKFAFNEKEKLLRAFSFYDTLAITFMSIAITTGEFTTAYVAAISPNLAIVDPRFAFYTPALHARMLITVSLCAGFGRLCFGYYLSSIKEPRPLLLFLQTICSLIVLGFSFVHEAVPNDWDQQGKFTYLSFMAGLNAFIHSGVNSCVLKYCRRRFRPAQYPFAMTTMMTFSNLGLFLCSLTIAASLIWFNQQWQIAARLCCLVTMIGSFFVLLTYGFPAMPMQVPASTTLATQVFESPKMSHNIPLVPVHPLDKGDKADELLEKEKKTEPKKLTHKQRLELYASWFADPTILPMLAAKGFLRPSVSFEGYLNLFLKRAINVDPASASAVGSMYPIGVMLSLFFGGNLIELLNKPTKANVTIYMCIMLAVFQISLAIWAGTKPPEATCSDINCFAGIGILLFLAGSMIGYPYYIPPTVFALSFGQDSTMMGGILEFIAMSFSAVFVGIVAPLAAEGVYSGMIGYLIGCTIIGSIMYTLFHYMQLKKKKNFLLSIRILDHLSKLHFHDRQTLSEKPQKDVEKLIANNIPQDKSHPVSKSTITEVASMVTEHLRSLNLQNNEGSRGRSASMARVVSVLMSFRHDHSRNPHAQDEEAKKQLEHHHNLFVKLHFRSVHQTPLGRLKFFHRPSPHVVWIASVSIAFVLLAFFTTYFLAASNPESEYNFGVWYVSNSTKV